MLGNRRGRVVDQVVGTVAASAVVEELDAHVPVDGEHPVAGVVHLVDQRPLGRRQLQADDRPGGGIRRRTRHGGGGRRDQGRQLAEQDGRLLSSGNGRRCPVARLAPPPCAAGVVVESDRELLNQTVKRNRRLGAKRPAGRHLLGRKHVEQDAEVAAKRVRVVAEGYSDRICRSAITILSTSLDNRTCFDDHE